MKEKIVLGIFVLSVLMVLTLGLIVMQNRITGKAIQGQEQETGKASCSDSDGVNYGIKGGVNYCDEQGNCGSKEDSCSGSSVTEWYCEASEAKSEEHPCEDGCGGGACLIITKDYKNVVTSSGGGGGGGGSSGASVSAAPSGNTYDLGELSGEQITDLARYDKINFKISGSEYVLNLQDNSETQATISIAGQTLALTVGGEKNIDLNSDGTSDVYIKIKSIDTIFGKVRIILSLP